MVPNGVHSSVKCVYVNSGMEVVFNRRKTLKIIRK